MLKKSLTIVSTVMVFNLKGNLPFLKISNTGLFLLNIAKLKTVSSVSISVVYCQSFSENILIESGPEDLFQGPVT